MKLSYITYLRLINNKLIREGVNLSVDLRDDMSISELEEAKTVLESYCYFNDVLTKCDSAYALDVTDGCKAKLYTDTIRDEVLSQYKEKFDSALSLLYQDRPNPLDKTATVKDLSDYLQKNGKTLKASDFAVEVDTPVSEEPTQSMQYADIFSIKPSNELIYTDESEDSDSDEDFDYSDDEEDFNEGIDSQESDEDFSYDEDSGSDSDDDVFYDFSSSSDDDEDESYEDEYDYSDESEGIDVMEELPLDDSEEQVVYTFDDSSTDSEEEFNYDEVEDGYSEEEEFDYSEDESEDEISYDEDEPNYSEDEEFSYEDESLDDSDSDSDSEDDFSYEEDDIDYSDDTESDEEDDIDYSEDDSYDEDNTSYDEDSFSYDEDDFSDSSSAQVFPDAPVFNVGSQTPMGMTQPRKKEDFERDAEMIEGIVEGGTRFIKGAGKKLKDSLFSRKL